MREDGILLAVTEEGHSLPAIDLTHPRFHVADDANSIRTLQDRFVAEDARRRRIPKFLLRFMLRSMAKKSRLVHALFGSGFAFLDGLSTYAMKLGADNLVPPYDSPVDKRFASAPHIPLLRLRMQQIAGMIADGLREELLGRPHAPLHLINIGGGPAMDSLNSLILLNRACPGQMQRPIVIHVLDGDTAGPRFGARALAALQAGGGPLFGLTIEFDHRSYDWNEPQILQSLLAAPEMADVILVASSEGALFEYGSDHAIAENLDALRAGGVALVAGSVTAANYTRKQMIAGSGFHLYPRGAAGFAPLAQASGFRVARTMETPLSDQVLLRPA
jgi:hypothetical protein